MFSAFSPTPIHRSSQPEPQNPRLPWAPRWVRCVHVQCADITRCPSALHQVPSVIAVRLTPGLIHSLLAAWPQHHVVLQRFQRQDVGVYGARAPVVLPALPARHLASCCRTGPRLSPARPSDALRTKGKAAHPARTSDDHDADSLSSFAASFDDPIRRDPSNFHVYFSAFQALWVPGGGRGVSVTVASLALTLPVSTLSDARLTPEARSLLV